MIEVSQLKVQKNGQTICHLEQLSVDEGETIALIGDNGSGKTTLLRVLAGLESRFTGTCRVTTSRRETTYLHQQPLLFRGTVLSNARYAQRSQVNPTDWLERLGVDHLANHDARTLSGGETRRVALARALATDAKLLILDEPLADLDPRAAELVCNLLASLADRTIIVASPTPLPEALEARTISLTEHSEVS